jgi:protein TonB
MFEQTLLTHPRATQKSGALFMSFAAQMLVCGVLLVVPLIFTGTLPALHMGPMDIYVDRLPPPPTPTVPEVQTTVSRATVRQFNPLSSRIPTRVPPGPVPEILVEAPILSTGVVDAGDFVVPGVFTPLIAVPLPKPAVVEPAPSKSTPPEAPIRVSEGAQMAKLIKKVVPTYPPLARQTRVSGTVKLLGIIMKDGRIRELKVLSGHPLLQKAALDAVSQWIYSPTVISGQAFEVEAPIDVIFEFR